MWGRVSARPFLELTHRPLSFCPTASTVKAHSADLVQGVSGIPHPPPASPLAPNRARRRSPGRSAGATQGFQSRTVHSIPAYQHPARWFCARRPLLSAAQPSLGSGRKLAPARESHSQSPTPSPKRPARGEQGLSCCTIAQTPRCFLEAHPSSSLHHCQLLDIEHDSADT